MEHYSMTIPAGLIVLAFVCIFAGGFCFGYGAGMSAMRARVGKRLAGELDDRSPTESSIG